MKKITIEDISRETGLSRGTVSRALNDRPDISEQTKQRVLNACKQLNYVPSHAARSLATGRCYAVSVVVDDLRCGFAGAFVRGVLLRAQNERYAVNVAELGADPSATIDQLCAMANERVDSILLAATLDSSAMHRLREALENKPLIACQPIEGAAYDGFMPDYAEAGRLVGRHILRDGAADILYVHQPGTDAVESGLQGFHEICRERGINPDQVTLTIPAGAPERFDEVRGRLQNLRALAASDDYLAIELMLLCLSNGRTPGRDVAVMGQGNEYIGTRVSPNLTSVDFCGTEIGQRAMDTALQRITKTRQDAPALTLVAPLLVERASTRMA